METRRIYKQTEKITTVFYFVLNKKDKTQNLNANVKYREKYSVSWYEYEKKNARWI